MSGIERTVFDDDNLGLNLEALQGAMQVFATMWEFDDAAQEGPVVETSLPDLGRTPPEVKLSAEGQNKL